MEKIKNLFQLTGQRTGFLIFPGERPIAVDWSGAPEILPLLPLFVDGEFVGNFMVSEDYFTHYELDFTDDLRPFLHFEDWPEGSFRNHEFSDPEKPFSLEFAGDIFTLPSGLTVVVPDIWR